MKIHMPHSTYAEQVRQLVSARFRAFDIVGTGWASTVTGSGGAALIAGGIQLSTGTTASSSARRTFGDGPIGTGDSGGNENRWFFSKRMAFAFSVARLTSDVQFIGRWQIKEVTTEGAIGATTKGIGIRIDNYGVFIESSDGTTQSVLDASYTMTDRRAYDFVLVFEPAASLRLVIEGATQATKTTNIPTGIGGGAGTMVISVVNGATGLTNGLLDFAFLTNVQGR